MRGVRHPRLDAVVTTPTTLVGIVSKRYQPFRPAKATAFTEPFDSRDWGPGMARFGAMRQALTSGRQTYRHLDAVTLVKQAYALRTQSVKRARGAVLVYLHAAPAHWASGKPVDPKAITRHQAEIADFARAVKGDDVTFVPLRWSDLLAQWAKQPALAAHAAAVTGWFGGRFRAGSSLPVGVSSCQATIEIIGCAPVSHVGHRGSPLFAVIADRLHILTRRGLLPPDDQPVQRVDIGLGRGDDGIGVGRLEPVTMRPSSSSRTRDRRLRVGAFGHGMDLIELQPRLVREQHLHAR